MTIWPFHTAKAKLSEVFRRARTEGPQIITVHGREEFVLVTRDAFEAARTERAAPRKNQYRTLYDVFEPVFGAELKAPSREDFGNRFIPFADDDDED